MVVTVFFFLLFGRVADDVIDVVDDVYDDVALSNSGVMMLFFALARW